MAQQVNVLLREENIILLKWKEDEKEWLDSGRGGFRIYKMDSGMVWLGLIQPGGRNILSSPNEVIINNTSQVWVKENTLRVNFIDKEGKLRKLAFAPLRSAIDLEDADDEEQNFEDFVKEEEKEKEKETEEKEKEQTTEAGKKPEEEEKKDEKDKEEEEKREDKEKEEAKEKEIEKEKKEKVDLLSGKQKPSFTSTVADILKNHAKIKVRVV